MRPERSEWVTALITLPRFYNPSPTGRRRRIEAEKLDQTIGEVGRQFGGCMLHEDPKVGVWFSRGIVYRDDVMLLEVDMPDSPESREWLIQYAREVLLSRFSQEAIYMKLLRGMEIYTVEARSDN